MLLRRRIFWCSDEAVRSTLKSVSVPPRARSPSGGNCQAAIWANDMESSALKMTAAVRSSSWAGARYSRITTEQVTTDFAKEKTASWCAELSSRKTVRSFMWYLLLKIAGPTTITSFLECAASLIGCSTLKPEEPKPHSRKKKVSRLVTHVISPLPMSFWEISTDKKGRRERGTKGEKMSFCASSLSKSGNVMFCLCFRLHRLPRWQWR